MSGEPTILLVGNVGGDPELRFTSSGDAVAAFSVANTPRVKNQHGEWVDGDTAWYRVTAWRRDAESVAEGVSKGDRVRVTGRLKAGTYEGKDGQVRVSLDVTADMDGVAVVPKPPKREKARGGGDPWGG